MPSLKVATILARYFNTGDGKKTAGEFIKELKELSHDEKRELAYLAAPLLGVEVEE